MSLADVIQQVRLAAKDPVEDASNGGDEQELGLTRQGQNRGSTDSKALSRINFPTSGRSIQPDTPSTRTGPPRSLSFAYSLSQTPPQRHSSYPTHDTELLPKDAAAYYGEDDQEVLFSPHISLSATKTSDFRTPLEHPAEKALKDKGKRREKSTGTSSTEESWNPLTRWFHESPREERVGNGEYFPSTPADPEAPPTIITRTFTQEPQKAHDLNDGERLDDQPDITIRSPTIAEEPQEDEPSITSKGKVRDTSVQAKQRGASYPEPPHLASLNTAIPAPSPTSPTSPTARIRRAFSVPQQVFASKSHHGGMSTANSSELGDTTERSTKEEGAKDKWARLRTFLPHLAGEHAAKMAPRPPPSSAVSPSVNIIDELITGGLATLMPKLWFERDEKGQRRIPVLLHRLRLRITDSLHPLHKSRTVFRIECEYVNGARWVVYRELRDFFSLHTHYAVTNVLYGTGGNTRSERTAGEGSGRDKLPDFPTTSIPYLKFLNEKSGSKIGKAEFARLQREQMENYLVDLIRVVMFHPSSNRLSSFLEISTLSLALTQSGGAQYKAGYLRIEAVALQSSSSLLAFCLPRNEGEDKEGRGATPFGRKSAGWRERKEQRWCAVRESYLVALEQPGELTVWDVFLLDSDFRIERPKRYYRQGWGGLLHHDSSDDEQDHDRMEEKRSSQNPGSSTHPRSASEPSEGRDGHGLQVTVTDDDDAKSAISSVKSKVSKIFHLDRHSTKSSKSKTRSKSKKDSKEDHLGQMSEKSPVRGRAGFLGLGIGSRRAVSEGRKESSKEEGCPAPGRRRSNTTTNHPGPSTKEIRDGKLPDTASGRRDSDTDTSISLTRRSSFIRSDVDSDHERQSRLKSRPRSDSDSTLSGARTPMLDPSTTLDPSILLGADQRAGKKSSGKGIDAEALAADDKNKALNGSAAANEEQDPERKKELEEAGKEERERAMRAHQLQQKSGEKDVSKHTFYIVNSQMRLKLSARNERQMLQFITALEKVAQNSPFTGKNRFDSFAPIRLNVAAQWLVDGRDYFWNLSRAILMAKESIYIHDWWLSPELLMRRPGKEHYRLDRLLERKAKEGVKIYIILYLEVSNRTTPTDSNYAKQRLMSIHPNVMVQRSPSHFQTGTFYWAHHEKLCVIDQTIAFTGGLDLCFGRWDTPQHVLTDDTLDTDHPEIWPGKDYSNPRVGDFHTLNKPEEDMYDRTKVHRLPWHDVAMQIVGQPARDLARHFVQRWNYLLRIKNHSKIMPFLLPPPEFRPGELSQLGLTGTCELQIVRSAGPWSMGTPGKTEQSVQNAYLKAIQMSEHFVYIENQFFITSTTVDDVKIENRIGDAIVQRIIRAHHDQKPWKCCIIIPLLPGFTFPVDHSDASAIRIILECQNRTISRGPDSIFSRLRKEGIDPDEYISVLSLRNWGKLRDDVLVTEQVYIHAKVCIVDDRLAIIGSANINERSQRGDRDSELAVVIRDTDMIDCTMAGEPFKVGRFAHTLRVRLMREHLGIDVDALDEEDLMAHDPIKPEYEQKAWDPNSEQTVGREEGFTQVQGSQGNASRVSNMAKFATTGIRQAAHGGAESLVSGVFKATRGVNRIGGAGETAETGDEDLDAERKDYTPKGEKVTGFASSVVPTLEEKTLMEGRPHRENADKSYPPHGLQQDVITEEEDSETNSEAFTLDGESYGAPANAPKDDAPPRPSADLDNEQQRGAAEVRSTLRKHLSVKSSNLGVLTVRPKVHADDFEDPIVDSFWKEKWIASATHNTEIHRKVFHAIPDDLITTWKQYKDFVAPHERFARPVPPTNDRGGPSESEEGSGLGHDDGISVESTKEGQEDVSVDANHHGLDSKTYYRKPAKGTEAFERWEREELLHELNGHLVIFPTRFLEGEDAANNFLFNADRLLPLPIYA